MFNGFDQSKPHQPLNKRKKERKKKIKFYYNKVITTINAKRRGTTLTFVLRKFQSTFDERY